MANEGELPGLDLKMPSLDLELPAPSGSLDLPGPSGTLELPDLQLDAPLDMSPPAPDPKAAARPSGKPSGKKEPGSPKKPKGKRALPGLPKLPGLQIPREAQLPVLFNLVNVLLLLAIIGIMPLFGIPANVVPDLTLDAYVAGLWLVIGCFVLTALFNDVRTALLFTGIGLAMMITVFPTLWLLLDTPMSPMYFYVLGLVVLQVFVAMPLNVARSRKPAIKKEAAPARAGAPVSASASTSPRTSS